MNAIVIARYDYAYQPRVELRDVATQTLVPLSDEIRRPSGPPFGTTVFASPTTPLAANTTYEVIAYGDPHGDGPPPVVATTTFATGDTVDTSPPAFDGVSSIVLETMVYPIANDLGITCASSCVEHPDGRISRIHVDYPQAPADAVHVALQLRRADDTAIEEVPLVAWHPYDLGYKACDVLAPPLVPGGDYCASVVAYDVAGNVAGTGVEVCTMVATCRPVATGSPNCNPTDACLPPEEPLPSSGCATSRSPSWLLLAALVLVPKRRTRRAFRGARRVL